MLEPLESADGYQGFIKISIQSRIEQYASYVTYEIKIETNDPSFSLQESSIRRRYSDFRTLHSMLKKQFTFVKLPTLPPKAPFKRSFDLEFVEKRREALEEFLAKMLTKKIYLSSRAFHLFLQSNLSMSEIEDIVEGKTPDYFPNKDFVIHTSLSPLNDEEGDSLKSNEDTLKECENPSTSLPSKSAFASNSNSPLGSKKVSFCDQVTVAEIHVS